MTIYYDKKMQSDSRTYKYYTNTIGTLKPLFPIILLIVCVLQNPSEVWKITST